MGILCFVCPVTGNSVSTNLEIDADSFSTLSNNRFCAVRRPDCARPHDLAKLATWLTDDAEQWTEDDAPVRQPDGLCRTAKLVSGFS